MLSNEKLDESVETTKNEDERLQDNMNHSSDDISHGRTSQKFVLKQKNWS